MQKKLTFRHVACFVILFVLLFFGIFALFHHFIGLTVYQNLTFSAPRGLYMGSRFGIDDLHVSDYVVITLPRDIGAAKKGKKLLKQVKGLPGDTFEVTEKFLVLHGHEYPLDRSYKSVPQIPLGRHVVPEGKYMFINPVDFSFDCRYMGPLGKSEIVAKVVPVLNYEILYARYMALKGWWEHGKDGKETEKK